VEEKTSTPGRPVEATEDAAISSSTRGSSSRRHSGRICLIVLPLLLMCHRGGR
jgi:hypothetical protein